MALDYQLSLKNLGRRLPQPMFLWAIGLILVALAVRLSFIGMVVSAPDTVDYLTRADALMDGEGFRNAMRTPGFLYLLAAFQQVGWDPLISTGILQNLIGIILPGAVLIVGWRYFNPATGVLAGLLTAVSPLMLVTEQYALTDYLFGVLLFGGVAVLIEAMLRVDRGDRSTLLLIGAGALFGLATLVRGNGQYVLVAVPLAALLSLRDWRKALRSAGIVLAMFVVLLSPWVIHNIVVFGTPQVTTLGAHTLYLRAVDHDRVPPPSDSADGMLARQIYDNLYALAPPDEERNSGLPLMNALEERGESNVEATSATMSLALAVIVENPSTYVSNTGDILDEFRLMYDPRHELTPGLDQAEYVRSGFTVPAEGVGLHGRAAIPSDSRVTRTAWELSEALSLFLYLATLGGLLVLVLPFVGTRRSRIAATVLLTTVLLGILTSALTIHFEPRFGVPFSPMAWLLLAGAGVLVARTALRGLRMAAERWPEEGLAREPFDPEEGGGECCANAHIYCRACDGG